MAKRIECRIENNHENVPALLVKRGVDCEERCCGLTLHDLNNFIRFLEGSKMFFLKDLPLVIDKNFLCSLFDETVKDEILG